MNPSLLIKDDVQAFRQEIDARAARFDRAFFHSGGAELSPLDYRDEFEALSQAVADLELALLALEDEEV